MIKCESLNKEILEYDAEELTAQKVSDLKSPLMRLFSEQIIIYSRLDERINAKLVGFTYETFFEYVMTKRIYVKNNWRYLNTNQLLEQFRTLVKESNDYKILKGALQYLVFFFAEDTSDIHLKMLEELLGNDELCGVAYDTIARLKKIDVKTIKILREIITFSDTNALRTWGRDVTSLQIYQKIRYDDISDVIAELSRWISSPYPAVTEALVIALTEFATKKPKEVLRLLLLIFNNENLLTLQKQAAPVFKYTNSVVTEESIKIIEAMAKSNSSQSVRDTPLQYAKLLSPSLKEKLLEFIPTLAESNDEYIQSVILEIIDEIGASNSTLTISILKKVSERDTLGYNKQRILELISKGKYSID